MDMNLTKFWEMVKDSRAWPAAVHGVLQARILKQKLQYFGHLMGRADSGKDPDAGEDRGQEEKEEAEDEMVGWHHQLNGHESEETLEDSGGQRSLVC